MKRDDVLFTTIMAIGFGSLFVKCFGWQIGLTFTAFIVGGSSILMKLIWR